MQNNGKETASNGVKLTKDSPKCAQNLPWK